LTRGWAPRHTPPRVGVSGAGVQRRGACPPSRG
jgi:hypothetical protein